MVVNPSVPAKAVPEFIACGSANPAKLNTASAGVGSGTHIAGELFRVMAGIDLLHMPYRGGAPAFTDLLGGQVQVYFPAIAGSIEYITVGKLGGHGCGLNRGHRRDPRHPTASAGFDLFQNIVEVIWRKPSNPG
jgi:tripartite-type tricarboxylate transporter receptor subunit TctC